MPTTAPNDPVSGDDILTWARAVTQILRQNMPRESADIWPNVGTAGTSFRLRHKPRVEVSSPQRHPFQVLITQTNNDDEELTVKVQRGSVVEGEFFNGGIAISNLTDEFVLTPTDNILWLEATFTTAGAITALSFVVGSAWTDFPNLYSDFGEDGNEWYHPIATLREAEDGEVASIFFTRLLDQLTSTHLVSQRQCIDGALIWKLVPGPGGII